MTIYFANPTGEARAYMADGTLGYIDTPRQRNTRGQVGIWCADNGCFSSAFVESEWWAWLELHAVDAGSCAFATAPDVVGDAEATLERSRPWLSRIRDLGYPAAYVAQNGATVEQLPWDEFDALFLGGSPECIPCGFVREALDFGRKHCPECGAKLTEWKLGEAARELVDEAKRRGLWVHMGRVNSRKRFLYAQSIGCDSADGTYLAFGPAKNLPKLLGWLEAAAQLELEAA